MISVQVQFGTKYLSSWNRVIFINICNVFLAQQKHFWYFNRKQNKNLQVIPHRIYEAFSLLA